jgi:hypothetical protein
MKIIAKTPAPAKSRLPFYFSFNPSKTDEVERVRKELDERGTIFSVESTSAPVGKSVVISDREAKQLGENGLFFRPAISYKVTIVYRPLIHRTQQFILPDPSRLYEIE